MKKILIPIDFSENADKVIAAAKIIADKYQSELLVLHAYEPYIADVNLTTGNVLPGIGSPDLLSLSNELQQEFQERLEEYVRKLVAEGYRSTALWYPGGIKPAVKQAYADHTPDLIILGRTGEGGFLDKLIGSSATDIALHASCPVLVIPPQNKPTSFASTVYATQLEYAENNILHELLPFTSQLGSSVKFLKVHSRTQPDIQPDHQYMAELKAEFNISDDAFVSREALHVIDGIEAYCDEIGADLLVVSARERSFIEEFLINPGLTKKLIVHTHIPLLVYHLT
ncbi:hypothetical protein DYBT9275_00812 [Dyadobacter sp. CECT 9275]|uniref:UspA domain-containing protein n=1 Tax=Dyadobacter helix TaxID=2822344 RepID=A0A916J9B9_9BACT|nr:universal stress protein [Dyadobacter sp. CECT 9275]CAG4991689.1 hypothetical protein DYBT9275_00812 [Dyadobacter sp. CECT 9275]